MVFFIFIEISIKTYVSKQWGTRSDAHFAASGLVLRCLPMSHKKDPRLIYGLILYPPTE